MALYIKQAISMSSSSSGTELGVVYKKVVFHAQKLNNYQLLDEVEQNITICRWRADQLFADAEGRGK